LNKNDLAEPLEDAHGTPGFRGTLVENHWPRPTKEFHQIKNKFNKDFLIKWRNIAVKNLCLIDFNVVKEEKE
jgi:hypothetical protein